MSFNTHHCRDGRGNPQSQSGGRAAENRRTRGQNEVGSRREQADANACAGRAAKSVARNHSDAPDAGGKAGGSGVLALRNQVLPANQRSAPPVSWRERSSNAEALSLSDAVARCSCPAGSSAPPVAPEFVSVSAMGSTRRALCPRPSGRLAPLRS